MSDNSVSYNFDDIEEVVTYAKDNDAILDRIKGNLTSLKTSLDKRIYESSNFQNVFSRIVKVDKIDDYKGTSASFAAWIKGNQESIYQQSAAMNRYAGDMASVGYGVGEFTPTALTQAAEKMYIDEAFAESLPAIVKNQIVEELKDAGFTDKEVENILSGKYPVNKLVTETLSATIATVVATNPEVKNLLQQAVGFDIFDEEGNVDVNKLQVAEIIAEKNLGMKIDMTPGSPFKTQLNQLASDLETIYKNDPTVRQTIIDKYGFDIFDENGKVDANKLALIRVIDGQDLEDDYDLKGVVDQLKAGKAAQKTSEQPTTPEKTTTPEQATTPEQPTTKPGEIPSSTLPPNSVTPIPGADIGEVDGPFGLDGHNVDGLSASISDGLDELAGNMMDVIDRTTGRFIKGIEPFTNGGSAGVDTKKSSAGIITTAGIVAGGAATGGGILLHKKKSITKFTPEDWGALGIDYQGIITNLMVKVGFSEEEIEKFKNTRFKIPTNEIKEHIKKIEIAMEENPMLDENLFDLYNYTIFDFEHNVVEYLLFITMIIDGKNLMDEYNMYNIINESFKDPDQADLLYAGIQMEDYMDYEKEEEAITEEEMQITNDKIEEQETKEELEEVTPSVDKKWMKLEGIE